MTALSVTALETWRGVLLDQRSAAAMADLAASVGPWVQPTQGSFRPTTNYSADTHAGAGAIDISVNGWTRANETEYIRAARSMGWAAWVRAAISGLWPRHIHQIMIPPSGNRRNDGRLSAGAWSQVLDYYAGRNGLANRGRDDGPRVTIRTYEQWLVATGVDALTDLERLIDTMDKDELRKMMIESVVEGVRQALWQPLIPGDKGMAGSSIRNNIRHLVDNGVPNVVEGVRQALWHPLIPKAKGVPGSSIRNNLLHIVNRVGK